MVIDTVKVGSLQTNCYILKKDNKCLIIDPGADYESIKEKLKDLEILGILITHSHFDHVGALEDIANEYHVDILGYGVAKEKCYSIGPFKFNVIFNPGHSNDSISFYFEECLFHVKSGTEDFLPNPFRKVFPSARLQR